MRLLPLPGHLLSTDAASVIAWRVVLSLLWCRHGSRQPPRRSAATVTMGLCESGRDDVHVAPLAILSLAPPTFLRYPPSSLYYIYVPSPGQICWDEGVLFLAQTIRSHFRCDIGLLLLSSRFCFLYLCSSDRLYHCADLSFSLTRIHKYTTRHTCGLLNHGVPQRRRRTAR
jgi:hypothetical protein